MYEGRNQDDDSTSQGTRVIPREAPAAGGEAWDRSFLTTFRSHPPCWHPDLRRLAPKNCEIVTSCCLRPHFVACGYMDAFPSMKSDVRHDGQWAGRAQEQILGIRSSIVGLTWRCLEGWHVSHPPAMDMTPSTTLDCFFPSIPLSPHAVTALRGSSDQRRTIGARTPSCIHTDMTPSQLLINSIRD